MEKSDKSEILFVGNHSLAHLEEYDGKSFQTYSFVQPGIREVRLPFLLHSTLGEIPCASYEEAVIVQSTIGWLRSSPGFVLIGDPSEWLVSGTIKAALQAHNLRGVLLIYPVGMAALDLRKEMAELILLLKKNNIPTYLIRNPKSFFTSLEPQVNSFVHSILSEGNLPETLEYLCGMPSAMELN